MKLRHTIVAHGLLAKRNLRLEAARGRLHGRQIMTFEAVACRLAGGFSTSIDDETLRDIIQRVLPDTVLGELEGIKLLPGMVDAGAGTLRKVWRSGIDLQSKAHGHTRIASVAALEQAVLERLPAAMMRPADLVSAGMLRLAHAKSIFGEVEIVGITELSPVWRPLLHALGEHTKVRWIAGPRPVPSWLDGTRVNIEKSEKQSPTFESISAATAYHEAIEAMRWARNLLASGAAKPSEIGIAATMPVDYDDDFLALRPDANLDLHFVHGVRVTSTREGQKAAALADVLIRGLSQTRLRRLATLVGEAGLFKTLPDGWTRVLPRDAPLTSGEAWERLLGRLKAEDWPDEVDHTNELRKIVACLAKGSAGAVEAGEALLSGQARSIWRKALLSGPAASVDTTIDAMKQSDGLEGSVCVAWMPASELAASPRRFVRLLGMNSSRWPRGISEDRLLSDHVIKTSELDPLPVGAADRRDFETILATTESQIILSRSRRDSEGRLLGRSPLLQGQAAETYLRRNAIPVHAMSETDRLLARSSEFAALPQAKSAGDCWSDWHVPELTPHDGLVRADHPVLLAALDRIQSASSLSKLLRNPLGFVWRYGLHFRPREENGEPLTLDSLAIGNLVHAILDRSVRAIETTGNLASASMGTITSAIDAAAEETASQWQAEQSIPPKLIWSKTMDDVRWLARNALETRDDTLVDAKSFCEAPFGRSKAKSDGSLPWDPDAIVEIPGTGVRVGGYIDRLDLSGDQKKANVRDYKTGKTPKKKTLVLNGGKELQRCLYAFAVKALLGDDIEVSASLFYPRDKTDIRLENPEAALADTVGFLQVAHANLKMGNALVGEDAGEAFDDLAFALPANPKAIYLRRKAIAVADRLGPAVNVWGAV